MVTHHKYFSVSFSHCPPVKLERFFVKAARARFLVVFEREPQPLKLSDLLAVFVPLKIYDMGDAQVLQLLHIGPGGYLPGVLSVVIVLLQSEGRFSYITV